jgi:hypothetical protein
MTFPNTTRRGVKSFAVTESLAGAAAVEAEAGAVEAEAVGAAGSKEVAAEAEAVIEASEEAAAGQGAVEAVEVDRIDREKRHAIRSALLPVVKIKKTRSQIYKQ